MNKRSLTNLMFMLMAVAFVLTVVSPLAIPPGPM